MRWLPKAPPAEERPASAASEPEPSPEPPLRRDRQDRSRPRALPSRVSLPMWVLGLGIVVLIVAMATTLVLAWGSGDAPTATAVTMTARAAAPPTPAVRTTTTNAPLPRGFRSRPRRAPFVVNGVRWAVFANPQQSWARKVRRTAAGPGQKWLLVAVRVRNLTRVGFDPRVLSFQIFDRSGRAYFPDPRAGTGRRRSLPPEPVPLGGTGQAELAFRVPEEAGRFTLLFDAGENGTGGATKVRLGSS